MTCYGFLFESVSKNQTEKRDPGNKKMTKARLTLKVLATFNSLQKGSEIIHAYSFHLLSNPTFFYKDFYFRGEGQWTNRLDCFFFYLLGFTETRLSRNEPLVSNPYSPNICKLTYFVWKLVHQASQN